MKNRMLCVLLVLCMAASLLGCTASGEPTQPPATTAASPETTVPPATEPDALSLYAQAKAHLEGAQNLNLTITATRKRTVGGETYTDASTQVIAIEDCNMDTLQISVQDSTTIGSYVLTAQEFYSGGAVQMLFESAPFTARMEPDEYLSRFAPAAMLDESLYESVTLESGSSGYTLAFSEPIAAESWLVPEDAELLSASGSARISQDGVLTKTGYCVSYRWGAAEYQLDYTVSISIPESLDLTSSLPASQSEYITLDCIDAPWFLARAAYDLIQTEVFSSTSTSTLITYAGGAILSQQDHLDVFGTGADAMSQYKTNVTLQNYTGIVDEYQLEEHIRNHKLTLTENEEEPIIQLLNQDDVQSLRGSYLDMALETLWTPQDLTGASIEDLGSVYLLELTGSDSLGDAYEASTAAAFWMDENFLRDMADSYRTASLTGYLSIDKYTQLPVAFGYSYEGIHTLDGEEYSLTDQHDQTFFLGSTTAYEAITQEPMPDAEPEEKATPLFYHVTGENGQEMWLIGTIHVGDDRTGFLPQEIYNALLTSDALAVEFDTDAFDQALETDEALTAQVQAAYFYPDGSMTRDHLDESLYEDAVKLLKATGNYFMNVEYIHPYLWSQSIDNFMLRQGYHLVSEKGVDNRLLKIARDNEIPILDIESGLFQTQMLTGFSEELQALLLEESLYTDSAAYCEGIEDLYEKWCAGDEAVLREELSDEVDTSELTEEELAEYEAQKHLLEEYNKAMSYDRNEGMLQKAIEYLESGETVFYAVGLAHLLNNVNGLVDALRDAGYTVELVTYDPLTTTMPIS